MWISSVFFCWCPDLLIIIVPPLHYCFFHGTALTTSVHNYPPLITVFVAPMIFPQLYAPEHCFLYIIVFTTQTVSTQKYPLHVSFLSLCMRKGQCFLP